MIDSKGNDVAFSNVKPLKSLTRYFKKAETIFCPFSLKSISDSDLVFTRKVSHTAWTVKFLLKLVLSTLFLLLNGQQCNRIPAQKLQSPLLPGIPWCYYKFDCPGSICHVGTGLLGNILG